MTPSKASLLLKMEAVLHTLLGMVSDPDDLDLLQDAQWVVQGRMRSTLNVAYKFGAALAVTNNPVLEAAYELVRASEMLDLREPGDAQALIESAELKVQGVRK